MITDASTAFLTASGFDGFVDQENPARILKQILRKGNIPHALLFTGLPGVGKYAAAVLFAMFCNCAERRDPSAESGSSTSADPCGKCRSCLNIRSGNHPDIIVLEPVQTSARAIIRIDQIRALCRTLALKPREALFRTVILKDAEAMNPESGNALLKILEEPPDRTIFILTARHEARLMPTILSRCQRIAFNPVAKTKIAAHLIERRGETDAHAALIAEMAGGSLSHADAMSAGGWIARRKWLMEVIRNLENESPGRILALAEVVSKNRQHMLETFDILETVLRDRVIGPHAPPQVINKDLTGRNRCVSQGATADVWIERIGEIEKARRQFESHANARLTLEKLLFKLASK